MLGDIPELKGKHKSFADIYLKDPRRNARRAYKKVYPKVTNQTADVNASKLLKNTKVLAYIENIERITTERVELNVEWVKKRLKNFSDSKITDYFKIEKGEIKLKDLKRLPKEIVDCIQEIRQTKDGLFIKLVDKKGSVDSIARVLGAFTDIGVALTFEEYIKQRKKAESDQT